MPSCKAAVHPHLAGGARGVVPAPPKGERRRGQEKGLQKGERSRGKTPAAFPSGLHFVPV